MAAYRISVNGMSCAGCEKIIRRELSPIPGIRDVEADHTSGEVIVHGEPDTKSKSRQAIADLGYKLV